MLKNVRTWLLILPALLSGALAQADEVLPPASERFQNGSTTEEPSFQRHLLPLMGRLGCNGRACHGSFQGQGGFRLSLFGYDFKADHDALTQGEHPRVDKNDVAKSLIVFKPTHEDEHEGGQRMEKDSWQFHIFKRWIESGAKDDSAQQARLDRVDVTPNEIQFRKDGEQVQLRAVAVWSNGDREDVTPICRFQTNDGSVATIDENGRVTCTGKGDTHVVVFYDNGITPVPVIQPVAPEVAANYPQVAVPTKIDELVVQKLKKLGVVPSDLCTDEEFLRRVSLDITGTLPVPAEIEAFVADTSPEKRAKKVDELLERPAYAAWWTTRLCDLTGNSAQQMGNNNFRNDESRQWYEWIESRVAKNVPYDELVAGIVLATGRREGQSFAEYCDEMSQYYRKKDPTNFAQHETLPQYWSRRNNRQPEEKALSFAYAFLGVRLQCAQCHKHPFDQWSQTDFQHFQAFFNNIQYNYRPEDKKDRETLLADLGIDTKKPNNEQQKELTNLLNEGKSIPFQEVFVNAKRTPRNNNKDKKNNGAARVVTPKVLGGDELAIGADQVDLRTELMEWMRDKDNPYFAKAIVNRVWANYFNVGIIEPPDDQNLANPPSNEALLQYLTEAFVAHNYDLKWLHREIVMSRTYQLSWRPNATNRLDMRNFSRAVPRRLPAETAYDAIQAATAGTEQLAKLQVTMTDRAIGPTTGYQGNQKGSYALLTFGKPARATNCDCERSMEPSLLQTLFLRNDGEMLTLIDRNGGWVQEVAKESQAAEKAASQNRADRLKEVDSLNKQLAKVKQQRSKLEKGDTKESQEALQKVAQRYNKLERQLGEARRQEAQAKVNAEAAAKQQSKVDPQVVAQRGPALIREAYLRTVSRTPTADEMAKAQEYLADASSLSTGLRDLMWALLNTKEFIVNH